MKNIIKLTFSMYKLNPRVLHMKQDLTNAIPHKTPAKLKNPSNQCHQEKYPVLAHRALFTNGLLSGVPAPSGIRYEQL